MKVAPYAEFPKRLGDAVGEVLLLIGIPEEKAHKEWIAMQEFSLGKTDNRSVLGTLKQFILDLEYSFPRAPTNLDVPVSLSLLLADSGSLVIPEFTPREAVRKLFGQEPARKPGLRLLTGGKS